MSNEAAVRTGGLQLYLVSGAMACFVATHTMVSLFVPLFAVSLGASPSIVGILVSLAFVFPLFLAMPVGGLADRIGSRRLITLASATVAMLPVAVAVVPGLWMLAIVQALAGIAHLTLIVSAQRYVSDLGRGRVAEKNFGWYSTFQSAGQMTGPLLGGILIDLLGFPEAFLSAGALAAVAFVLSRFLRPGGGTGAAAPIAPYGERGQVKGLLGNNGVRLAILISSGVLVAQSIRQTFLPVYLEELQYAATIIGIIISLRALMSMMVRPFMPVIVRKLGGRSNTAFAMVAILAIGLGITSFIESLVPLAITSLLVGIGSGITQPLTVVTVSDHVERSRVGFALGLRLTGNRLAQVVSPVVIGLLAEFTGVRWTFLMAAATLLVTGGLILRLRAPFERAEHDLARAEERSSAAEAVAR